MSADGGQTVVDPTLVLPLEDLEAEFRVVASRGVRRGMRLERVFWRSLRDIARRRSVALGHFVADLAAANPSATNVASLVRGACVRWLARENESLARLMSNAGLGAILAASPAPAFALSSDRRIAAFNAPFQLLVRRHFPEAAEGRLAGAPRLALDMSIPDIVARLASEAGTPVRTGFAIGMAERRVRGALNVVRAPSHEADLLLAFVAAIEAQ